MTKLKEEIKKMINDKALVLDGFTTNLFHACWNIIKEEPLEIVEQSRKIGKFMKVFNSTFLSLIPKENGANSPSKFRPIALCNVILKIVTKTIDNRLKPLLPSLISTEQ